MADIPCNDDYELHTLLDLNGETFYFGDGYWVQFKAWRVKPDRHTPHGIKYSLSLHDKNKLRIIGYDNAHGYQAKKGRYKAKKVTWDHIHKRDKVYSYEFDSASQLIDDFWKTVEGFV
ncbi:MAG: hypothetical protein JRE40_14745 [Deltaproteobacteria bacterium]|nr:hypothetical protein [Deltaproteobacteria bacterium]